MGTRIGEFRKALWINEVVNTAISCLFLPISIIIITLVPLLAPPSHMSVMLPGYCPTLTRFGGPIYNKELFLSLEVSIATIQKLAGGAQ